MTRPLKEITDNATQLKQSGHFREAIELYAEAARSYPESAVAEHNLAAALGDIGRADEAEEHIRRAFAKGLNAPESWLVLARALLGQGKLDEASDAFRKTIELDPNMMVALFEYAQLVWMTTSDSNAALAPVDARIRISPDQAELYGVKARVMMYTVGAEATHEFVTECLVRWPNDARLLGMGVDSATRVGKTDTALAMSERLLALQPHSLAARDMRLFALLAAERADEALSLAESILEGNQRDQHTLAMLATACRLVGDPRYEALYNYRDFVRTYTLATPEGWDSLEDYLSDLGDALRERHPFETHPFSNSEEHGSKISDILEMDNAAIRAFPDAISAPIEEHIQHLGTGTDPLRVRNTGRWKIDGIWSVLLKPEGFHHNHVHPDGWLSSACYIELPDQVDEGSEEGWIRFGKPGLVTRPELAHAYQIKPEPGMLVLFPSYMWHGTVPFGGEQPRLTVAFDIVPD